MPLRDQKLKISKFFFVEAARDLITWIEKNKEKLSGFEWQVQLWLWILNKKQRFEVNMVWLWFTRTFGDVGTSYLWRKGWQEPSTAFPRCSPPHTHTFPGRIPRCSQSVAHLQTQHKNHKPHKNSLTHKDTNRSNLQRIKRGHAANDPTTVVPRQERWSKQHRHRCPEGKKILFVLDKSTAAKPQTHTSLTNNWLPHDLSCLSKYRKKGETSFAP